MTKFLDRAKEIVDMILAPFFLPLFLSRQEVAVRFDDEVQRYIRRK